VGKPLMLQEADAERIESLKKRVGARTKIEVVRSALDLLERDAERVERVAQWRKAVGVVARESRAVLRDFRPHSRCGAWTDAARSERWHIYVVALDPGWERSPASSAPASPSSQRNSGKLACRAPWCCH